MNKETVYSLRNVENYKDELDTETSVIIEKVSELILDYFTFIQQNIKLKNTNFSKFIMTRGLDTMINVFNYVLLYTKNIDVTYFHCQKSFCFYVEFVSQISEDEKMFLQLSSRDACTYVYKKTIFELKSEAKKVIQPECREKLKKVDQFIELYKTIIIKLTNDDIQNTYLAVDLCKKLNTIYKKIDLTKLNKMIDYLFLYYNTKIVYKLIDPLFKKIAKNPEKIDIVNKKWMDMDRNVDSNMDKNMDTDIDINKIVYWLLN